jgi:protein-tyrosine phosphatase
LQRDGVTAVAGTPHLNASEPNGPRRARADLAWPELVEASFTEVPGLELYRGYEIQLDVPEVDLSDPDVRLAGTRFALIEFCNFVIPERSAEMLARIVANGYVPILVHPERYWGFDRDFSALSQWRAAGAIIQLNSGSLLDEYGAKVSAIAHRFLLEGSVDLIASDNHARPERSPSLREAWDYLAGRGLAKEAGLLLSTNPQRILNDGMPLLVGPMELRGSVLSRLGRALRGDG